MLLSLQNIAIVKHISKISKVEFQQLHEMTIPERVNPNNKRATLLKDTIVVFRGY